MDGNQVTFEDNKYTKWYDAIIVNAKSRHLIGYVEKHHIVPRSLGGSNLESNIVSLTAREHFVCHMLLTRITSGYHQVLMRFALGKFIQTAPGQERSFTSWEYSKIREAISQARTGRKHSDDARKKMSDKRKGRAPWNKGIKQGPHSEESNKKRSATLTGRERTPEFCQKVSEGKKGHKSGMTGKKHSEETKIKMSSSRGPQGPQQRINKCPYCSDILVTSRHIKFCKIKLEKIF
jgi:hypothetical protein